MSRKWTARKKSTLDEAGIDPAFAAAYPVFRAGPEPAAARREVIRLLVGFTLAGLPVHCGICWLAAHSLGLAVAAVLVTVTAILAVALARWLALEELLQRLPLLLVLGLVGVGLVFVTSQPTKAWGVGSFELFGTVFILIAVVSVLGGLYRPLAAAYQTVTLRVPFRDLCVSAAAMLVSLGLAAMGETLPRPVLPILACLLAGAFAGLVVVEYAAWARANPGQSLERVMAFAAPVAAAGGRAGKPVRTFDARAALLGAAVFGLSYGVFSAAKQYGVGPASELHRLLPPPSEDNPGASSELLASLVMSSLVGMPFGLIWASSALNAFRLPRPFLAVRLAWDAVVVFLTYPETAHPLAHRLHTPWLRPQSVRLAGTCVVLLTAATAFISPSEKKPASAPEKNPAAAARPVAPPRGPQFESQGDAELARLFGRSPHDSRGGPYEPPPPVWMPPPAPTAVPPAEAPASQPSGDGVPRFVLAAFGVAAGGPVFLFLMVWLVGLSVLPTYFRYFEKPAIPGSPG